MNTADGDGPAGGVAGAARARAGWRTVGASLLVPTSGVLPAFLLGGLSVQIQDELGFGETGLGAAVAVFFGAAAVGSALAGRLIDRLGALRGMRFGVAGSITCLLAVAGGGRSLPTLLGFLAVGGFANAACQISSNAVIASRIRVARQGLAFAAKQSSIPLATLLGGLAVPAIALTVGWRWAFVAGAGLALVALVTTPAGRVKAGGRDSAPPGALPLAPLAILAVAGGLGAAAGGAIGSFLVASAVDVGISPDRAGLLLAASSVCILVTRLIMGLVADHRGRGFFDLVAAMLALGSIGFVLLSGHRPGPFAVGAILAGVTGWGWPGLFNLAVVDHDRSLAAMATGVTQTGVYLGAVVGPLAFGSIAEHASFPAAWLLTAAVALVAAGIMLVGRTRLRRAGVARPARAPGPGPSPGSSPGPAAEPAADRCH